MRLQSAVFTLEDTLFTPDDAAREGLDKALSLFKMEGVWLGAVTVDIERAALGELGVDVADEVLVEVLAAAVLTRADAWAVVANTPQGAAGPLAPVLGEYFDMVPLLGRQVAAVSPNGLPLAVGVFAGLDIWGRATIKADAGEQEFPPEAVRIRGL